MMLHFKRTKTRKDIIQKPSPTDLRLYIYYYTSASPLGALPAAASIIFFQINNVNRFI